MDTKKTKAYDHANALAARCASMRGDANEETGREYAALHAAWEAALARAEEMPSPAPAAVDPYYGGVHVYRRDDGCVMVSAADWSYEYLSREWASVVSPSIIASIDAAARA